MDSGEQRLRAVLAQTAGETGLDEEAIEVIVDHAQIAYFREGATIDRAGVKAGLSKFVLSGVVRLMFEGARQGPMVVQFVKPGLPLISIMEEGRRSSFSSVAHGPAGIAFVSHELIAEVVAQLGADRAARFARYSWSALSGLVRDKCELLTGSVSDRLLHELGILAGDFGRRHGDDTLIDLALTQEHLAQLVVVDRSTVNRNLRDLEKAGYVSRSNGRYVLCAGKHSGAMLRAS